MALHFIAADIKKTLKKTVCPDTARKYLHILGFRYKTPVSDCSRQTPNNNKRLPKNWPP